MRGATPFKVLRWIGINAYVVGIPKSWAIHPVLNVIDLVPYHDPIANARGFEEHLEDWNKEVLDIANVPSPNLGEC